LEFRQSGGMVMPANERLHQMAVQFAEAEMGCIPNFAAYPKVFVACELDADGEPQKIVGLSAIRMVPDIEQMRYLNSKAAHAIIQRMHDYLMDQGIARGSDVFVRIVDGHDPFRCPQHIDWLHSQKAIPGERWVLPLQ
jgi:hypothetical protein